MAAEGLDEVKIYEQLSVDIRATDEVSFKLLGLVPLVSGTGLIALLFAQDARPSPQLIILLSLFAAAITLGLFRWELRNIQNCRWLIKYADELEKKALGRAGTRDAYVPQLKSPQGFGKTEAEKFIYAATITTWLTAPALFLTYGDFLPWLWKLYVPVSAVIAFATVMSIVGEPKSMEPAKGNATQESHDWTSSRTVSSHLQESSSRRASVHRLLDTAHTLLRALRFFTALANDPTDDLDIAALSRVRARVDGIAELLSQATKDLKLLGIDKKAPFVIDANGNRLSLQELSRAIRAIQVGLRAIKAGEASSSIADILGTFRSIASTVGAWTPPPFPPQNNQPPLIFDSTKDNSGFWESLGNIITFNSAARLHQLVGMPGTDVGAFDCNFDGSQGDDLEAFFVANGIVLNP